MDVDCARQHEQPARIEVCARGRHRLRRTDRDDPLARDRDVGRDRRLAAHHRAAADHEIGEEGRRPHCVHGSFP